MERDRNPFRLMKKLLTALAFLCALNVHARQPTLIDELSRAIQSRTDKAPATAQIESGFSPDGGAERLILKVINGSQTSIRLAAYSFTSTKVVRALVDARKRGVDVRMVVDNEGTSSKSGTAALNLLANADIPIRTNGKYAIHHDKYIISDGMHVQTGSFNYSQAAAASNSENVIVIWHNPDLAVSYLRHWQSRFDEGVSYRQPY
jgi:phosphatidylserine/phosphatidylglycerophosphate/cardiolipin synthase-like enzyme